MAKRTLDLDRIFAHQRRFTKERKWGRYHTPKNLAMALAVEASELLELFQWLTPAESKKLMKDPAKAKAVRHELVDVLYYLLRLTDLLGVDLDEAFWEKMEHNARKYPVSRARGNARKYTEL